MLGGLGVNEVTIITDILFILCLYIGVRLFLKLWRWLHK